MPVPVALPPSHGLARPVALRPAAVAVDGRLRVADLITAQDVRGMEPRIGDLVVARFPEAPRQSVLRSGDAVTLLRRRVPGLAVTAPSFPTISVTVRAAGRVRASHCYAAARPLAAGEAVAARDLSPAECRAEPVAGLRRDLTGTVVARNPVPAGAYLGRVAPVAQAPVARGTALTLRAVAGPAAVERTVTALQSGRSGRPLFVRSSDGAVFAVPLQAEGSVR